MSQLRLFVPLVLFLSILVVGYVCFSLEDPHKLPSALLGKPFPPFRAPLLHEPQQVVDRDWLVGEPVLVNVWATWCPTCAAEHDELLRIKSETGLKMVGINYKDNARKARQWLVQHGNPFDATLIDSDGSIGVDLGVYGAPETFVLDAQGIVRYKRVGDINPRVWRDDLAPLLRELEVINDAG